MGLSATLSIRELWIIMLIAECHNFKCYAEYCRYAECYYAERHYALPWGPFVGHKIFTQTNYFSDFQHFRK
jgi:hypothetical protein